MARIIGGLAVSHTPTIGFAVDHGKQEEAAWAPIFKSFGPVRDWLKEKKPDVLFYIFNDHITSFFFDHYSAFTLGVDDEYGGLEIEHKYVLSEKIEVSFLNTNHNFDISDAMAHEIVELIERITGLSKKT